MTKQKKYILYKFLKFVEKELGITQAYSIKTSNNHAEFTTTAYYDPEKQLVSVYVKGRAIIDIMRSFAHELVHHHQRQNGEVKTGEDIQDIGGKIEDDANAIAGQLIKKFTYANKKLKIFDESIKKN